MIGPRLEPGIRVQLGKGMAAVRTIRRLDRFAIRFLALGIAVIWGGFLVMGTPQIPGPLSAFGPWMESAKWVFALAIAAWSVALGAYAASALQGLIHAADVRRLWSFYELERTSSLAREVA